MNCPDSADAGRESPPRVEFYDRVLERLRALPGVDTASLGRSVPFSNGSTSGEFSIEGMPTESAEVREAQYEYVDPEWFRIFHVPLEEGRTFTFQDGPDSPPVAVISERLARRYWPGTSPIGKRIKFGLDRSDNPWRTIVGVAGEIQYVWFEKIPPPVLYAPYRQTARQVMQFVMRVPSNPLALAEAARKQVATVDPDMPIFDVKTHDRVIHESLLGITLIAGMMAVLGIIALVLASVGLYGVMANAVIERTHEVGVRMALGAGARDILRQMLVRGIVLTGIGLTIGLVVSYVLASLLSSLIIGVSANDMATFGCVVPLLALVSLAATYIPARRATRLDPLVALRHE